MKAKSEVKDEMNLSPIGFSLALLDYVWRVDIIWFSKERLSWFLPISSSLKLELNTKKWTDELLLFQAMQLNQFKNVTLLPFQRKIRWASAQIVLFIWSIFFLYFIFFNNWQYSIYNLVLWLIRQHSQHFTSDFWALYKVVQPCLIHSSTQPHI